MIPGPSAVALLGASALEAVLLAYASYHGARILARWDLSSGSELQLRLERRTYLVSTLVAYGLVLEIVVTFLFVYTADALAPLFTGAMCAAGSLTAGPSGYAALGVRLVTCVAAGVWLVLNHLDGKGDDYPLIRRKYALLLALAPVVALAAALQARYLLGLRPEVITSCCGSLFARSGAGLGADLAALPARGAAIAFYAAVAAVVIAAAAARRRVSAGLVLAGATAVALPVSLAAVVAFVSPYVYELPTHHCPFCLLKAEYGYVGYLLYAAILGGGVTGLGAGAVAPFRGVRSLAAAVPPLQRRLATATALLYALLAGVVTYRVQLSHLRLP